MNRVLATGKIVLVSFGASLLFAACYAILKSGWKIKN